MKLLITGGAGFIGSNFIHYWLDNYDDEIINLDLLTYAGNLENLQKWENDDRYELVKGDICDKELVDELVAKVDIVVNFAAESHVDRSILGPEIFVRTNVLGTQNLLEAIRKHGKRFHHVSTDEVFGSLAPDEPASRPDSPYRPRSPYAASKAASDHLVRAYFVTYDLPVTISNTSNNYGPYHFPEKIIPLFITNLLEDKKVPIYGDGRQIRDWIHVLDHCRGIDAVLKRGVLGETYLFGGDNQTMNIDLTKMILNILGKDESYIEYVEDRKGHDVRYDINSDRSKEELGWKQGVKFEEGLKQTIEWYKENIDWWKRCKSGEYMDFYQQNYKKLD